jgi:hypothetical protein
LTFATTFPSDSDGYEALLATSIPFLSLKCDGMANTLVLEAIARNLPILAPRMRSVVQAKMHFLGNTKK